MSATFLQPVAEKRSDSMLIRPIHARSEEALDSHACSDGIPHIPACILEAEVGLSISKHASVRSSLSLQSEDKSQESSACAAGGRVVGCQPESELASWEREVSVRESIAVQSSSDNPVRSSDGGAGHPSFLGSCGALLFPVCQPRAGLARPLVQASSHLPVLLLAARPAKEAMFSSDGAHHPIQTSDEGAQASDVGSGGIIFPVRQPGAEVASQYLRQDGVESSTLSVGSAIDESLSSELLFGPMNVDAAIGGECVSEFSSAPCFEHFSAQLRQEAPLHDASVFSGRSARYSICSPDGDARDLNSDLGCIPISVCDPTSGLAIPPAKQSSARQVVSEQDPSPCSGLTARYSICSSDGDVEDLNVGFGVSAQPSTVLRPEVSAHLSRLSNLTTRLSTHEHLSRLSISGAQAKSMLVP